MSSDEKKIDVLKKAVVKLQTKCTSLEEDNAVLQQRAAAADRAHEATREELREARDETEVLKYNHTSLEKRIVSLQEDVQKAKQDTSKGWAPLTGFKDMVSGRAAKEDQDREVLEEELQRKIAEAGGLHTKIFEMQRELDEAKHQRELLEGKYGTETMGAVSRISELEEELRVASNEERRLTESLSERTESLSELQSHHKALLVNVREVQTRLVHAESVSFAVLADTTRLPQIAQLNLSPEDTQRSAAASSNISSLAATIGSLVRDVEALFANSTERIHILLSKATATEGPVRIAALRLLKDSLRKANAGHAGIAQRLVSQIDFVSGAKAKETELLEQVGSGEVPETVPGAGGGSQGVEEEGAGWALFICENLKHVLVALFSHSPGLTEDDDQSEEIARLQSLLCPPLESFNAAKSVTPASLRQLKSGIKELTEAVTGLFAKEVRVAWELTGFDGVNKRIVAVLKALHMNVATAVELRTALTKPLLSGPERSLPPIGPAELLTAEEKAVLPEGYLDTTTPYNNPDMARVRMHCRTAAFMKRVAEMPLEVDLVSREDLEGAREEAGSGEGVSEDVAAEDVSTAAAHCTLLESVSTPPEGSLVGSGVLAPACQAAHQREVDAYKHALVTSDAKAVEYRIDLQRCLFHLEAKEETAQGLEEDNRDLKRRLRNRDTEVKNMSHGYTDQMKVFQDRILDLENRLAAASSKR